MLPNCPADYGWHMTDEPNLLGDYLRTPRELVSPGQAGIPVTMLTPAD